jgi:hypothetical protein
MNFNKLKTRFVFPMFFIILITTSSCTYLQKKTENPIKVDRDNNPVLDESGNLSEFEISPKTEELDDQKEEKEETQEEFYERYMDLTFLAPDKKDIVGKWEGFVFYKTANHEIIDLDDSDSRLDLVFYLNGNDLRVKAFGDDTLVNFTKHEKSPYANISFRISAQTEIQEGVSGPIATYDFEANIAWERQQYEQVGNQVTLGSDKYKLRLVNDGKSTWKWGEMVAEGEWSAEKVE